MATSTTTMASMSTSSSSSTSSSNHFEMTPSQLNQFWQSYGVTKVPALTVFSQTTMHIFSNYVAHPPVTMELPHCCNATAVATTGRSTQISFTFAEQAIMACKAALFRDYTTMDAILKASNARAAKALGRQVSPFDQTVWDRYQCTIVKQVTIAKLAWQPFCDALLQTGDSLMAECSRGDWVWGTSLDVADPNVWYPAQWRGHNILGWSLMEARDVGQRSVQQRQQHLVQAQASSMANASAPPMALDASLSAATLTTAVAEAKADKDKTEEKLDPHSIKYLARLYSFGPKAFGPLQSSQPKPASSNTTASLSSSVKAIIEASHPAARTMRGERGRKQVTRMLQDIYDQGLFMHGSPTSSVNQTIIPAMRCVMAQLEQLQPATNPKRVAMARDLAEACQDCQQVQARVILRLYGDLTAQNATLESQLQYSLVRSKEAALQALISKHHAPSCDLDHTQVGPEHQRAHLWSGYIALIGSEFGLDGVTAAHGDRFLSPALEVIRGVHSSSNAHRHSHKRVRRYGHGGGSGASSVTSHDSTLQQSLMQELTQSLSVQEWLAGLLGDINNQNPNADRLLDRSCIFDWASKNMQGDFKHRIFYDDSRQEEYTDLDPKEPTHDNQYEPFLSPVVLVEMLVRAGMLQTRTATATSAAAS